MLRIFVPFSLLLLTLGMAACGPASKLGPWQFLAGQWTDQPGGAVQSDTTGRAIALQPDARQNYSASVKVHVPSITDGASAGLVVQAVDTSNYIALTIEKRRGFVFLVLKTAREGKKAGWLGDEGVGDQARIEFDPSRWYELRAEVEGAHVAGYLDDKPLVSFSFLGKAPEWNTHGILWDQDLDRGQSGLYTNKTAAEFQEFRLAERGSDPIYTPYRPRRDAQGKVVAKQSYAETMKAWTEWCADSARYLDYRDAPREVQGWPFYLLSSFAFSDDKLGTDIQYPGHNHPPFIEGYVKEYLFTGDKKFLDKAREVADWNLTHSTPKNWAAPHLALSHFDYHKHVQSLDSLAESDFEPDKSAFQGLAYLQLYAATDDKRYLDGAVRIADTLHKFQRADGGFPFRIQPRTGKITAPYTASIIWYVRFFEDLAGFTKDHSYRKVRDKAFQWLMANPVRTNDWRGFYGDIATTTESYDQWTALDTAMYLLDRRHEDPTYESIALGLVKWVEDKLVVKDGLYEGVPGIWEQTSYKIVLTIHTNRLAEVYARLWTATGNTSYRDTAEQIGNSITWFLTGDGKMRAGLWYHGWGTATSGIIFNSQFMRIMAEIPETAPRGENHFQFDTAYVRDVSYGPGVVSLRTWTPGEARLTVKSAPSSVTDDGRALHRADRVDGTNPGWSYDEKTGLLRVGHSGTVVEINLTGN